jgi:hypothetical protein
VKTLPRDLSQFSSPFSKEEIAGAKAMLSELLAIVAKLGEAKFGYDKVSAKLDQSEKAIADSAVAIANKVCFQQNVG